MRLNLGIARNDVAKDLKDKKEFIGKVRLQNSRTPDSTAEKIGDMINRVLLH